MRESVCVCVCVCACACVCVCERERESVREGGGCFSDARTEAWETSDDTNISSFTRKVEWYKITRHLREECKKRDMYERQNVTTE